MHEGKQLGPNIEAEELQVLLNLEKESYPAFMMSGRFFFYYGIFLNRIILNLLW